MRPLVPGELVRPGEPPVALRPRALEGLLSGVAARVRLQVARLGVQFAAVGERAREDLVRIVQVRLGRGVFSAIQLSKDN